MKLPTLVNRNNRPIALDRELGVGGEGTGYSIQDDPTSVAKVYHPQCLPTPEKIEKLSAMIAMANKSLRAIAAWPSELIFEARTRQVAGFIMPRIKSDCEEIWHVYNPVQRLKSFPKADWAFQTRVASNLAAAFEEVHQCDCLVADVQLKNAYVSPQALVWLIDCDSFQVRANGKHYLCEVGLPHYTPPELQGKQLRGLVRTENHDCFGLAVLIYQLLFVGRHPYAGVYTGSGDPSFEQLISEFRFAQGPNASKWGMSPPPFTPTFSQIPNSLGVLFQRAFERGGEQGTRPKPAEWLAQLRNLERETVVCSVDGGHKYWKGCKECPWCRISSSGGPEYYYGVSGEDSVFAVDEPKLKEVLRRLERCQAQNCAYARDKFLPESAIEGNPYPEKAKNSATILLTFILLFAGSLILIPLGYFHKLFCFVAFFGAAISSVVLAVIHFTSPLYKEVHRRRLLLGRAEKALWSVESDWKRETDFYYRDHDKLKKLISEHVTECRDLSKLHQNDFNKLATNAESMARIRFLRLHLLADAEIPKIGAGRKQTLAAHNIFSAADIEESLIQSIKGFKETLAGNLMSWRNEILSRFKFDKQASISTAEKLTLALKYRQKQSQIIANIDALFSKIDSLYPNYQNKIKPINSSIRRAVKEWLQAKADVNENMISDHS